MKKNKKRRKQRENVIDLRASPSEVKKGRRSRKTIDNKAGKAALNQKFDWKDKTTKTKKEHAANIGKQREKHAEQTHTDKKQQDGTRQGNTKQTQEATKQKQTKKKNTKKTET